MSTVNLPDASKLDSDADTIKDSRPELKKMADAINTIGGQWNTNGGNFGTSSVSPLTENLDTNNFDITNDSSAGGDIKIKAGTNGDLELEANNLYLGRTTTGAVIETPAQTSLSLATNKGASSSLIRIQPPSAGTRSNNINLRIPYGSPGDIVLEGPLMIQETGGTPSNTSTPASWLKVTVIGDSAGAFTEGGVEYYLPLYS
jgi:hypothetical protein